jgi:predicted DCC family thiol-disulfide oxidoreductase YuxK
MDRRHERADLPPIDDAALARAMHLVTPDGRVYPGGRAVRELLRWLPGGWALRPLFRVPGMQWVVDRGYDWVAARRHRLGCGGDHCSWNGDRGARRSG